MSGMPLFMGGQAACLSACLRSWPVLPSMTPIMAPVPLHVSHHHCPQQGVPTCLSTRGEQSWKTIRTLCNIILHMRVHFMLWEQFIRPSLKAMRTLVIRPLQGYGNTASLSYPNTWVRKPDCLHLPYKVHLSRYRFSPGMGVLKPPQVILICRKFEGGIKARDLLLQNT